MDYDKKLEQAKLARMQGIKLNRPEQIAQPKKNRIEEALGGRTPSALPVRPTETFMPTIAARKPEEKKEASAEKINPEPAPKVKQKSSYGGFLKTFFTGMVIIILLGVVGVGGYTIFKSYTAPAALSTSDVVARVGKLVELPAGETPTVATVSDLKPLAGEDFFKEAAVGDKVLIFGTSKKAILYRPSTDKIIQAASLNQ